MLIPKDIAKFLSIIYSTYQLPMNKYLTIAFILLLGITANGAKAGSLTPKCNNPEECQALLQKQFSKFKGSHYSYGSTGGGGFDCSGLVLTVVDSLCIGSKLPRSSQDMFRSLESSVPLKEAKTGDLLFFNTGHGVSHVGFYYGRDDKQNDLMFHSSSSKGVELIPLNGNKYWTSRLVGVKRMAGLSALFAPVVSKGKVTELNKADKEEVSETRLESSLFADIFAQ